MYLILAAAPLETALLRQRLVVSRTHNCGSRELLQGNLCATEVLLGHGGIGAMLMSMQLTRILATHRPQAVLLCGCGGSYPGSGLAVGDLALASAEIYGDCGVATASGFVPLEQLNIPQQPLFAPVFQQKYSLENTLFHAARKLLPNAVCGPFVTINCGSGSTDTSLRLEQQTGGICENMEGAAAAQVCAEFSCPLLEVRGISNPTGTRETRLWDIPLGVKVAQDAICTLLQKGISSNEGLIR